MLKDISRCLCLDRISLLFIFPGDAMSSSDMSDYTLSRAYLTKNTEQYARCYNSGQL